MKLKEILLEELDEEQQPPISYSAIVLDQDSRNDLVDALSAELATIQDWEFGTTGDLTPHHMTIVMDKLGIYADDFPSFDHEGNEIEYDLVINGIGFSDKVLAVRVGNINNIQSKVPHITVAVNRPDGKARDSNEITNWKSWTPPRGPLVLTGHVEEVPQKDWTPKEKKPERVQQIFNTPADMAMMLKDKMPKERALGPLMGKFGKEYSKADLLAIIDTVYGGESEQLSEAKRWQELAGLL